MKDCVGNPVQVGSVITYPGRVSSTLYINTAIVKEIYEFEKSSPVLVLELVGRRFKYDSKQDRYRWMKTAKKVSIYVTDRITVTALTPEQLHKYYEERES